MSSKLTDMNNNKIKLIYADDELPAREKLGHQLSLMDNIEVVGVATNGKEAVSLINDLEPEVVLLDIQMPEVDGLELVDLLNYQPIIIYTTAYDQFAIQAFEKSSTDYLLKPFQLARLKTAIDKAEEKLKQQRLIDSLEVSATKPFEVTKTTSNKLVSKNGERILLLSPADLKFIKSEQGNSLAWNGEKFHYLSDTLDQLEQSLSEQGFIRIHRSYLINVEHIKEIQRWFNGKLMLIVNDDNKTELSTSRAGADKLKQVLGF